MAMETTTKYFAVRLSSSKLKYTPSTRYLTWIDNNWYETTDVPMYLFTEEQIPAIEKQMRSHYIYHATFVSEDGTEVMYNAFKPKTEEGKHKGITFSFGKGIKFNFGFFKKKL